MSNNNASIEEGKNRGCLSWLRGRLSWLGGCLSVLFILIIVVGLFGNKSITIPAFWIIKKGFSISLTNVLCILSIFIAILSGCIVYQKDKEKKEKQQDMKGEIEELEAALKAIYRKGK